MNRIQMIRICWLSVWLAVSLVGRSTWAETDGFKEISAPEVKNLIEEKKAVVVNLLSRLEHQIQHIPGSISIPIVEIDTTDKLPKDKDAPIVFYCMGKR